MEISEEERGDRGGESEEKGQFRSVGKRIAIGDAQRELFVLGERGHCKPDI